MRAEATLRLAPSPTRLYHHGLVSAPLAWFTPALLAASAWLLPACSGGAPEGERGESRIAEGRSPDGLGPSHGEATSGDTRSSETLRELTPRERAARDTVREQREVVAYVDVEHAEKTSALAHFAEVRGASAALLEVAGLVRRTPEAGRCEILGDDLPAAERLAAAQTDPSAPSPHAFELLSAGAVRLTADGQPSIQLAPRAFPQLSTLASGVVYTTRDSSSELPAGLRYQIDVGGSERIAPMKLQGVAPQGLQQVTVNGEPFTQLSALTSARPYDITWQVGNSGDVVYVDLATDSSGAVRARCAFADDAGAGTVPLTLLQSLFGSEAQERPAGERSPGRVTLHRVHVVRAQPEATERAAAGAALPQRAELRFDFEVGRSVQFVVENPTGASGER